MGRAEKERQHYDFGNFRLDLIDHQLLIDGKEIPIQKKTYEILLYLILNNGRIVSKKELHDKFWTEAYIEDSCLNQQIYLIRKALNTKDSDVDYVRTIPKYGYQFVFDIEDFIRISEDTSVEDDETEQVDGVGGTSTANENEIEIEMVHHFRNLLSKDKIIISRKLIILTILIICFLSLIVLFLSGLNIYNN